MTSSLDEQLAEAEALVERLKQQRLTGTCEEVGHTWKQLGGMNAGCCDECHCSVPVHSCTKCGDCDYGENDEADYIRKKCSEYDN